VVLLIVISAWLFRELLDRHAFDSHEHLWPYLRTVEYLRAWRAGQVIPQSFPNAIGGGGYAFPRFYPPFAYALAAALAWVVGDPVLAVHLCLLLSVVLSAVAMHRLGLSLSGSRPAAFCATLAYLTLPYRFVDVFVRGALAESWMFVTYPLVFLGLVRVLRTGEWPWYLPVAAAWLLLTHALLVPYLVVACLIIGWSVRRSANRRQAGEIVVALAIGGSLAGWHLLPQQLHLRDVWAGDRVFMWASPAFVQAHRVMPSQLAVADASHWFGRSTPDGADGMSFSLGLAQIAVLPLALWYLLRKPCPSEAPLSRRLARGLTAAWLCAIAFMISPGGFVAVLPAAFSYIQFPWRLLGLSAVLACSALAIFIASLPRRGRQAAVIAVSILAAAVPGYQRSKRTLPAVTAGALSDSTLHAEGRLGYTALGEYLPRSMPVADAAAVIEVGPVLEGRGEIVAWRRAADAVSVQVVNAEPVDLILPVVRYDFIRVVDHDKALPSGDAQGRVLVHLSPGRHSLSAQPGVTRWSWAGLSISGAGLVLWVAALQRRKGRRNSGRVPMNR
jgi:hypothetical protein